MNAGFAYLKKRGLTTATVKEFSIFYFDGKKIYGYSENLNQPYMERLQTLVFLRDEEGKFRFTNSIIFPVFDLYSNLVSIYTRKLDDTKKPKFDSYPFTKSEIIYGLNKTNKNILMHNKVFLTEGIFDFLILWQRGIKHSVAICGCFLTKQQLSLLFRFTQNINIIFDTDAPGRSGALRARKMIKNWHGKGNTIFLNRNMDLDEYLLSFGTEEFLKLCPR